MDWETKILGIIADAGLDATSDLVERVVDLVTAHSDVAHAKAKLALARETSMNSAIIRKREGTLQAAEASVSLAEQALKRIFVDQIQPEKWATLIVGAGAAALGLK